MKPIVALATVAVMAATPTAAAGQWDRAWGQNVDSVAPGTGFEICTVAADCTAAAFNGTAPGAVNFPEEIAAGPDGDVYMAGADGQDKALISKYDADGHFLTSWGGEGTTGGLFGGHPYGIAVDASGNVYVTDTFDNRVEEFTSTGAFIRAWGWGVNGGSGFEVCTVAASCTADSGHGEGGGFREPYGIAVDGSGHVYVAEQGNRRVQKFTVTAGSVTFDRAWGADVVTTGGTGAEVCTVAANCKGGIDGAGKGGETGRAVAVTVDPAGDVYVAESDQDRIEEFTPAGAFVRAMGKGVNGGSAGEICTSAASCQSGQVGNGGGEFRISSEGGGASFRPSGQLYVTDSNNDRIQVLSPAGAFLREFGAPSGQLGGQLGSPTGVAAGPGEALYVSDFTNRRVQKFFDGSTIPTTLQFSAATYAGNENDGTIAVTVERSGSSGAASVHFQTSNGTATTPADYTGSSGTVQFSNGQTQQVLQVPINDDGLHEDDETFAIALSDPVNATLGTPDTATLTIHDDDPIDTQIFGGPSGATNSSTASFAFTANPSAGATFECSLDGASFAACPSSLTLLNLAQGPHDFKVRAKNATDTDATPATRSFFVDTVAPTSTILLTPNGGSQLPGDSRYSGKVLAAATASDPAPASGVAITRCVLDPPSAPTQFIEMPACSAATAEVPGVHTFYAASQDLAGNVEPVVVKRTFTIVAPPDTTITFGPTGATWNSTPSFAFTSTVAGSTFVCRMDNILVACVNPYTPASPLAQNGHVFSVAAVSPEGVVDPTPATRTFSVAQRETVTRSCSQQVGRIAEQHVIVPYPRGTPSSITKSKFEGYDPASGCTLEPGACPLRAKCTIRASMRFTEADQTAHPPRLDGAWGFIIAWQPAVSLYGEYVGAAPGAFYAGNSGDSCQIKARSNFESCTAEATSTVLGGGRPIVAACYANPLGSAVDGNSGSRSAWGPDDQRNVYCDISVVIEPAATLETTTGGETVSIWVSEAGTVDVTPSATPRAATAAARKKKRSKPAAFKPIHKKVTAAGVVTVRLALSKDAAKTYKAKGKLTLSIKQTFTPTKGKKISKTRRITLIKPVIPKTPAQLLRDVCRKNKKLAKLKKCKNALAGSRGS